MIPGLLAEYPGANEVQLCRILGISRSATYKRAAPSAGDLLTGIERLVTTFLGYGYRRVHRALVREGFSASRYQVRKLMRENGLAARRRPSRGITREDPPAQKFENLTRKFEPTQLDEIWATDMTAIRTKSGVCYLAVVLDSYSRKVVSWRVSRSPDLNLALSCLENALRTRKPARGWIRHSDQGSVYTAPAYGSMVRAAGGRMSMSRAATPTDDAYAESFFKTLKQEEVRGNRYDSFLELEATMTNYIENLYNGRRMHSSLGYLSPDQFEAQAGEPG